MKILIVGGAGFIGRHIARELDRRGHDVTITCRKIGRGESRPKMPRATAIDYRYATSPSDWISALEGIKCVINAAGILRESTGNRFEQIHHRGPCALFQACALTGISRIIQISALGADESATTGYYTSKRAADECLRALNLNWIVLQPSVVYGPESGSGRMFNHLAALPLAAVPGRGEQRMQPVHVGDLAEMAANLVENPAIRNETIAAVGPTPLSYGEFLRTLRASMGRKPACLIGIPMPVMQIIAKLAALNPASPLTPDTLLMLQRGSIASPERFSEILGHPPRPPEDFETR